ncbi:DUF6069 family protein [Ornithinimicrobium murale]|uniref:DUF6069 family protein n=1 Tax=Ornithinimicrobium murale TaxID=1050153 RepID=UPI000E0D3F3D|nr:DUF6069 family protein [Ornithinimicrobium murale]
MTHHTTARQPSTVSDPTRTTADPRPQAQRSRRALVIAGATAAAVLLWLVAGPVLGTDLQVLEGPGARSAAPVTAGAVITSTVVAGLLGWSLLAVLQRLTSRGATIWRWVASLVALLSLCGPLTLAQSSGGTVALALLHVLVAGILILALPGRSRAGATG